MTMAEKKRQQNSPALLATNLTPKIEKTAVKSIFSTPDCSDPKNSAMSFTIRYTSGLREMKLLNRNTTDPKALKPKPFMLWKKLTWGESVSKKPAVPSAR